MNAVNAEGWRIVALCRLASPIPSTIQNAIFGLTRIELWPYLWATFLFTIPQTILYVYLGAIGKAALLGESEGVNLGVMIAGGLTFLDRRAADHAPRAREHARAGRKSGAGALYEP